MRSLSRSRLGAVAVRGSIGVVALAILVLLTPFSAAATVHAPVIYTAPFVGKTGVATDLMSVDCKVTGKFTMPPVFNLTTGVESLSEKSTAKSCPSALGYGYETTAGDAAIWTPAFHGVSGLYHVVVKWKVTWSATLVASLGPTHTGSAHASVFLVGILYLYDATNLTYLPATSSWGAFNVTFNGTLVVHHTAMVTIYLNQTVNSTHTYHIATWIDGSTMSYAASSGPSSASASLNMGSAGNGAKLLSIVRS